MKNQDFNSKPQNMYTLHIKTIVLFISIVFFARCSSEDVTSSPPIVTNVMLQLDNSSAVGTYTYTDAENDREGRSTFKWYRADDANGTNREEISGATTRTYLYTSIDYEKYLAFEVTPVEKGGIAGATVISDFKRNTSKDLITLYTVSGTTITKKIDYNVADELKPLQENTEKHQEVWNRVLQITPEPYLSKITEFMIFAGNFDTTSDFYQIAGYVVETKSDLSAWQYGLALDYAITDDPFITNAIITHELGHIVTLNDTQVDGNITNSALCETHQLQEGCIREAAYIYPFYKNYWANIDTNATPTQNYEADPNGYVTEYAATNVLEDIAETFRFYVFSENTLTDISLTKNKKINELKGHAPLEELRTYIRGNIFDTPTLAKKGNNFKWNIPIRNCGTHRMRSKLNPEK